ncbi:hypothetical protein B0A48_16994 [Cryoendolithus antarcticus]|uniref:Uncharacterized protein n=1 Tax=Cryoendolithus antarcticus TaxID=1507870 RepID=A0A1V8SBJ1_9PEZI|nr:hypothetical protein B0A48_16994 [Cryoendolithus antarcticus]
MATRRVKAEDWAPVMQTRIKTRASPPKGPREEGLMLPRPVINRRPTPLDIELAQTRSPARKLVPTLISPMADSESVRDAEVVDLAPDKAWHQQDALGTLTVRRSMSFGILDYYIRDVSPLQSPELPVTKTPVLDPAIDKFEFGLAEPKLESAVSIDVTDVQGGVEHDIPLLPLSPPPPPPASVVRPQHKKTYSLFPAVNESSPPSHRLAQIINDSSTDFHQPQDPLSDTRAIPSQRFPSQVLAKLDGTPSRRRAETVSTPSPPETAHTSCVTSLGTPRPSATYYRHRKESLVASVRGRKDSCASQTNARLIPLRILSSSSTASRPSRSSASTSTITGGSPNAQSRWSEDTITSPVAVTTPRTRTSFGSLVGGDSSQHPACFFEDDDESVPLRRKFQWQRAGSLTKEGSLGRQGRGRFDDKIGFDLSYSNQSRIKIMLDPVQHVAQRADDQSMDYFRDVFGSDNPEAEDAFDAKLKAEAEQLSLSIDEPKAHTHIWIYLFAELAVYRLDVTLLGCLTKSAHARKPKHAARTGPELSLCAQELCWRTKLTQLYSFAQSGPVHADAASDTFG